ncbi:unnamed protein product [Pararhodospirillum photometricum DSM 122]|uniref:Uncharacterized protein n=1 Tax=Pararhodospirillum photometricum DSM 122 TaxID=1150469 RepID=H6SJ98_PARPM|nr:unnamed protein product [Pararhodospirillum photometricum DSM 122]
MPGLFGDQGQNHQVEIAVGEQAAQAATPAAAVTPAGAEPPAEAEEAACVAAGEAALGPSEEGHLISSVCVSI